MPGARSQAHTVHGIYNFTRVYSCCRLGLICAYTKFFFEGRKRVIAMESMLAGKLTLVGMKHNAGSTMAADTFWATVS